MNPNRKNKKGKYKSKVSIDSGNKCIKALPKREPAAKLTNKCVIFCNNLSFNPNKIRPITEIKQTNTILIKMYNNAIYITYHIRHTV